VVWPSYCHSTEQIPGIFLDIQHRLTELSAVYVTHLIEWIENTA